LLDPVCVNPNSLETISQVLRHIGQKAEVKRYGGKKSEWVIVVCDGLLVPYLQIVTLIQDALICAECNTKVLGFESLKDHYKSVHQSISEITYFHEFDWVVLKTGDGHVELNLMK
jgi:hypothetical protein